MKLHRLSLIACLGVSLGLATAARAISDIPAQRTHGSVTYVSGGIGSDEADEMKSLAVQYPLDLVFLQNAEYLADVQVRITDAEGDVLLDTRSEGPYLLAALPDGRYTIIAECAGTSETRHANVSHGKHQMIVFEWAS